MQSKSRKEEWHTNLNPTSSHATNIESKLKCKKAECSQNQGKKNGIPVTTRLAPTSPRTGGAPDITVHSAPVQYASPTTDLYWVSVTIFSGIASADHVLRHMKIAKCYNALTAAFMNSCFRIKNVWV